VPRPNRRSRPPLRAREWDDLSASADRSIFGVTSQAAATLVSSVSPDGAELLRVSLRDGSSRTIGIHVRPALRTVAADALALAGDLTAAAAIQRQVLTDGRALRARRYLREQERRAEAYERNRAALLFGGGR
jgi:hypothetical protein